MDLTAFASKASKNSGLLLKREAETTFKLILAVSGVTCRHTPRIAPACGVDDSSPYALVIEYMFYLLTQLLRLPAFFRPLFTPPLSGGA